MKKYLLCGGNFYKANLHTHSTVSDGKLTPEEIKTLYLKKGYSVVAFTDHNDIVPHNELSDENFLAITSFELDINCSAEKDLPYAFKKTYHLNFYAKDKNARGLPVDKSKLDYSVDCVNTVIADLAAKGFLATYNHPVWSLQNYSDYAELKGLWGVEVYNSVGDIDALTETEQPFSDLLRKGNAVMPIAGDDMHDESAAFGGFTVIAADSLEYGEITSAMERGNVYSSTGPEIKEISIDGGILTVRCDPVKRILLNTDSRYTMHCAGNNVCEARFDLKFYLDIVAAYGRKGAFIRITLDGENGKKAWSRAYFTDELK